MPPSRFVSKALLAVSQATRGLKPATGEDAGARALGLVQASLLEREHQSPKSSLLAARGFQTTPPAQGLKEFLFSPAPLDPFSLVKHELENVTERLRRSIFTDIPVLSKAASYFFQVGAEGKRLRPTMLLLMASALSKVAPTPALLGVDERPPAQHPGEGRRRQQRIAEITEMIHVASLLHDDVIDDAETRRGLRSLNAFLGNKLAILAGDFLLARASVTLASLRDYEVIQLLSQVIEDLVSGEVLQMTTSKDQLLSMQHYIRKTTFKTASLMANSCQAIAILGEQPREVSSLARQYGHHLGLAFQLVDDMLDYTASSSALGKPALHDLQSGLATAPVLYAAERHPELRPLILRKFQEPGDVAQAKRLVFGCDAIDRTRQLAVSHAQQAAAAVDQLPASSNEHAEECRQGLKVITEKVISRTK